MLKIVKQFPFKFTPYKENIFVTGMTGTGKTERVRRILQQLGQIPYWIWAPQDTVKNYGAYGYQCNEISRLSYAQCVYTGEYNPETFIKFIKKAFYEIGTQQKNIVLIIDDVHEVTRKQQTIIELNNLVLSGRNRGISSIFISPRPQSVPNFILANVSHIFAYRMKLQKDIEWMRDNYFGNEAWLLLTKDLRRQNYISENDMDMIPDYGFLYRKVTDMDTYLVIP